MGGHVTLSRKMTVIICNPATAENTDCVCRPVMKTSMLELCVYATQ